MDLSTQPRSTERTRGQALNSSTAYPACLNAAPVPPRYLSPNLLLGRRALNEALALVALTADTVERVDFLTLL